MQRIATASEIGIADAVRHAAETKTPLEIVSGGTKRKFGRPVAAETMLDVSAITGIVKYEPEELVITARAATPLAEIEAVLATKKQTLGFAPTDWGPLFGEPKGKATLAGIVATNASGARRVKAGAARDHVIGCRFVNGRGEAIKAGGFVIKNVTGFDLPKLMCGAFGTLGVLTELTLRVTPAPPRVSTLALRTSPQEGLRALREAAKLSLDPTGLAYIPDVFDPDETEGGTGGGLALIRVEGSHAPLEDKLARLTARFAGLDTIVLDDDTTRILFRDIGDGKFLLSRNCDIWRLCVPQSDAHAAVEASGARFWYADWAGGLLWLGLPASEETATQLRFITKKFGGHATLMRGDAAARARLPVFEPEAPARATLTRSVKHAFDPETIFNPGRMYKDL